MPKDRYRLYHVEKAKGGIALTMTARLGDRVARQPAGLRQPPAYEDEIVPWLQATDRRRATSTARR